MSSTTVPSPCTGVCRIDPTTAQCQGCQRTLSEIEAWSTLSNSQKLMVWRLLRQRRSVS